MESDLYDLGTVGITYIFNGTKIVMVAFHGGLRFNRNEWNMLKMKAVLNRNFMHRKFTKHCVMKCQEPRSHRYCTER